MVVSPFLKVFLCRMQQIWSSGTDLAIDHVTSDAKCCHKHCVDVCIWKKAVLFEVVISGNGSFVLLKTFSWADCIERCTVDTTSNCMHVRTGKLMLENWRTCIHNLARKPRQNQTNKKQNERCRNQKWFSRQQFLKLETPKMRKKDGFSSHNRQIIGKMRQLSNWQAKSKCCL